MNDVVSPQKYEKGPTDCKRTRVRSGITESRDADSNVSVTPLPINQRYFSYITIFYNIHFNGAD